MITEERLEKLERELADLRAELATCVETREIRVVDENGEPRAGLGMDEYGPRLILLDENDGGRVWLGVEEDGPRLALFGEKGQVHAMLGVSKYRTGLVLSDENGKVIWQTPR